MPLDVSELLVERRLDGKWQVSTTARNRPLDAFLSSPLAEFYDELENREVLQVKAVSDG